MAGPASVPSSRQTTIPVPEGWQGKKGMGLVVVSNLALLGLAATCNNKEDFSKIFPLICTTTLIYAGNVLGFKKLVRYLPQPLLMAINTCVVKTFGNIDTTTGIWHGKTVGKAQYCDRQLCEELTTFFKEERAQSVIDWGCGVNGSYVKHLTKQGIKCTGLDGNEEVRNQLNCLVTPIHTQVYLGNEKADCSFSLEVGDKIPENFEDRYLSNLVENTKNVIVISWAHKGQEGFGHLNCRDADYLISKFNQKGWDLDLNSTTRLRKKTSPTTYWLGENLLVFRPQER